jgi:hypothetical protein
MSLPPDNPDVNPTEMAFAKLKAYLFLFLHVGYQDGLAALLLGRNGWNSPSGYDANDQGRAKPEQQSTSHDHPSACPVQFSGNCPFAKRGRAWPSDINTFDRSSTTK